MWTHERQAQILARLGKDGKVAANDLASEFSVSRETVRRDLMDMEKSGLLRRVHGGAVPSLAPEPEPAFAMRQEQFASQKEAIGQTACALIPTGSTCFIDAGTTTSAFAHALAARGRIRVITNSLEIARIMVTGEDCDTLLLGGAPHADVPATYGEMTLAEIDRFRADFAVISPVAVDRNRGVTDYELHEAEVARKMIRNSHACMVLCHSAKLNTESRVSICRLDEVDLLVTDAQAEPYELPRGTTHYAPAVG
ncbi:DeoR/GlpR family DNA-binding transcription regulator [Pseudooceanicola sp. CBS1P-1]|uniref:DeoR family transcriptional regulator n=1 Tax=Pseudooceanicola albus TaxID=2692189 RepID=A0A6L7G407_9RHOB|nr:MULTISPECIES: DeoR/GlpR family DNA-binding transcription regulator [Pseudooceanicola]MBT9385296.1 DeoR/GlpR family DNA-binding transcription regulator [Pseudooceanicola endophyticus]MXN18845.1 DeoR family transcriptional regulator [Pseudooceanicola albus]